MMQEAAEVVLGHPIPVDCKVTRYPGHYVDARGAEMYTKITELLAEIEAKYRSPIHPCLPSCPHPSMPPNNIREERAIT